jgi:hypothetical protein
MRAHDAAPRSGIRGHGKIDGNATRIQRCGSCAKPSATHFCQACLRAWPMLSRLLSPQVRA